MNNVDPRWGEVSRAPIYRNHWIFASSLLRPYARSCRFLRERVGNMRKD